MRSDYALYVVALIFFAIAIISIAALSDYERNVSVVATVVLGLLFAGVGYSQKPRPKAETTQAPPIQAAPAPPSTQAPPPLLPATEAVEALARPPVEPIALPASVETELPRIELTAVKGIKEKRAEQLRALGIGSVEELANASAVDLAKKLKISPTFTQQWIENAKKIIARS
jgi:predicted flap endonuclease-1-like 5' DNA nuclease